MSTTDDAVTADPVLPDVSMHLVPPTEPVVGRVVRNELCMKGKSASFVRHVAIDVSGTPLAGNFRAGQSFGVIPPGVDARGRGHKVRLYSIASPTRGEDGAGNVLSTTCKRLIDERSPQTPKDDPNDHSLFLGTCSNHVCDLREGDEVLVSGPAGKRFLLPEDPSRHDYLFVATGTGIAPFRGMLLDLLEGPDGPVPSRIELLMGVPYTTDLLYDDELRALAEKHPNFTYRVATSRETPDPDGGRADRGYVDRVLDRRFDEFESMLRSDRSLVYLCGLAGMQVGVFRTLAARGCGDGFLKIHEEVAGIDPAEWTTEQVKRRVRPSARCMLEVY